MHTVHLLRFGTFARPAAITIRLVVSPRLRLAVLPFSNLSGDSNQDYFSDGLTEELIAQLRPLCRGDVGVIARWSTMVYKGSQQRAREIGLALQADYLLEGSTRSEGSRVRITARLVEAGSEADRWSGTCRSVRSATGCRSRPLSPAMLRNRSSRSWQPMSVS